MTRRELLTLGGVALAGLAQKTWGQDLSKMNTGFRPLFDGRTLRGWKPHPRSLRQPSLGKWTVEDGMIVGGQATPGVGSYLVTGETFADFELLIEGRPDWPADTGILVRTNAQGNIGFQVLFDYRPHGGIGGYYGNGLGNWLACGYGFTAANDPGRRIIHVERLIPEKLVPHPHIHPVPLDFQATPQVFLRAWKLNGWNQFRIRSVGAIPRLTTWINGEKISELDTVKIWALLPGWNANRVLGLIGRSGHIALEVHSNGPHDWLGKERWWPGDVCRWRNISIKTLSA